LGDAASTDRPGGFEALRMVRVARRLRAEQICVTHVFTLREGHLHQEQFDPIEARPDTAGLDHALSELTGATPIEGNEITLELANDQARRGLFQRIERAKQRIHFQTYIVRDDAMARETEQRLQAAASRGVRVRILADSLLSMHGSFGQQNPVLERLVATPGIDVQVFRPVEGVPDLSDLKQRNHRKLWVFDGDTALVTGRNLGSSYFTAFHEVALSPQTSEDGIPWLDAGAVVRGPLVTSIEASFRADWTAADGDAFELCALAPVGTTRARWVLHDGLADAHTLDAYLAIIRGARKHLYVVNTFPLQHEALHALLAAIRRGVRLRVLVGNVRPTYGPEAVRFPGTMLGDLATQVVYGRLDALVEEGAEVYEFTVARQPGWDEEIDFVRPHVHAKLVSADGEACTIGSANLDVTAGYWESEGLLVVEDRGLATELERRLDEWIEASIPIDRDDPTWRRRSSMRTWLTKLWPSIIA
ncbi:MAG: phospholipase D-like domain-containing protein, partial [Planctomycetota bacterium]